MCVAVQRSPLSVMSLHADVRSCCSGKRPALHSSPTHLQRDATRHIQQCRMANSLSASLLTFLVERSSLQPCLGTVSQNRCGAAAAILLYDSQRDGLQKASHELDKSHSSVSKIP